MPLIRDAPQAPELDIVFALRPLLGSRAAAGARARGPADPVTAGAVAGGAPPSSGWPADKKQRLQPPHTPLAHTQTRSLPLGRSSVSPPLLGLSAQASLLRVRELSFARSSCPLGGFGRRSGLAARPARVCRGGTLALSGRSKGRSESGFPAITRPCGPAARRNNVPIARRSLAAR